MGKRVDWSRFRWIRRLRRLLLLARSSRRRQKKRPYSTKGKRTMRGRRLPLRLPLENRLQSMYQSNVQTKDYHPGARCSHSTSTIVSLLHLILSFPTSLTLPSDEESDLIHKIWLTQQDYHDPNTATRKPESALYMADTSVQSVQIMQPQYLTLLFATCASPGPQSQTSPFSLRQVPILHTMLTHLQIPQPPQFHDFRWFSSEVYF